MKVSLCFFCVLWNDFILFQSIFFNRINPLLHVLDRFEEFFELQNNQPMNEEQRKFSEELIRKLLEV